MEYSRCSTEVAARLSQWRGPKCGCSISNTVITAGAYTSTEPAENSHTKCRDSAAALADRFQQACVTAASSTRLMASVVMSCTDIQWCGPCATSPRHGNCQRHPCHQGRAHSALHEMAA